MAENNTEWVPEQEVERLVKELSDWWHERADIEVKAMGPKTVEYGGGSLVELGRPLAQGFGHDPNDDQRCQELGIWVHMKTKIERWTTAVLAGESPSDDTLHDIAVYCKMMQRVRQIGGWPFAPEQPAEQRIPGIVIDPGLQSATEMVERVMGGTIEEFEIEGTRYRPTDLTTTAGAKVWEVKGSEHVVPVKMVQTATQYDPTSNDPANHNHSSGCRGYHSPVQGYCLRNSHYSDYAE